MIKVASLYTGVGGLDFGFAFNDAFEHVFANEWNKDAAATFKHNYRKSFDHEPAFLHVGDIATFIETILEHDLLLGGFPCPAWSIAGMRGGFDDVRGREFFNCLKVVTNCKPKMFVFENVKGLLSHNNGASIAFMVEKLIEQGYQVTHKLHKFSDYGIPQKRERVFMVGFRNDIKPFDITFPNKPAPTIVEVLNYVKANCILGEGNHNNHLGRNGIKGHWMKVLLPGENLYNLSIDVIEARERKLGLPHRPKPQSAQGYVRMAENKVANTMMFGNTCLPIHPTEPRSISVREAAQFQSFPLFFEFLGGIAAQYKQVGNAVPYKIGQMLANLISSQLS